MVVVEVLNRTVHHVFCRQSITYDLEDEASSPHDRESGSQLSQCDLDSTVLDPFVSSVDKQDCEMVMVVEKNRMNRGQWKVSILESSTTSPQLVVIYKKTKLSPQV